MEKTLRKEFLDNGLTVEFFDRTNRYYGDYHRLKVDVRCCIPVTPAAFPEAADPEAESLKARCLLGDEAVWERSLEKMGVCGADVEAGQNALIDGFIASSFTYLQNPLFPARFIARELTEKKKSRPLSFDR